nr:zinc finger CW-type PWWP domain protein 1-like [Maniola hyperantus]
MPPIQNRERKTNVNFAEDEKPDSQSSSSYKDALSQPADSMTHRQRLLWLQQRRAPGLWAQCDDCNRWRYLPTVVDRHDLPVKWYCRMNPDSTFASCSAPEIPIRIHDEENLIYSEYSAGSLVVARMDGWPWWPAMVDDCPDTEQYYWLDGFSDIPTHYHVVFFDALEVTRAWVAPSHLQPYKVGKKLLNTSIKNKSLIKRLESAKKQADDAEKLSLKERLTEYSFIARYKGSINTPKKINVKDVQKFHKLFKRKFSVALPNELSDSEKEDDQPLSETSRKRNVITLGTKKAKVKKDNEVEPINQSLVVEVDTNSDLRKATFTNDTPTTYAPDTTVPNTVEESHEMPDRVSSPGSGDFDF